MTISKKEFKNFFISYFKLVYQKIVIFLFFYNFSYSCTYVEPDDPQPGPHQTILTILRMYQTNNFTGIDDYLYSVEITKNVYSNELILEGIKRPFKEGDFSFSVEGYQSIVYDYKHLFTNNDQELLKKFFLNEGSLFRKYNNLYNIAKNNPEKIWFWFRGDAGVILIEDDQRYKLLYTKHIGQLRRKIY